MAEVSWLSDYVSGNDRSADRFGLASNQGLGQGAPAGVGLGGFGAQGIAGLLGIGTEGDAQSWQEQAQCAETDPEAFFPEKGGSTREAKRVCMSCEVRAECLDYALAKDERFGICGGLSERERRRVKKQAD